MTVLLEKLSNAFNALIPGGVNKSPRLIFFERGKLGIMKTARPLDTAARMHDLARVNELLDKGANPNLITDASGPAIVEAVKSGDLATVKAIVERGGDINGVSVTGCCALHAAIMDLGRRPCQKDILEYLLSKKPRLDLMENESMTPLQWARHLDDEEGERLLTKAAGVDPLDELKPYLQPDGIYLMDATIERLPKSVKVAIPKFRAMYCYAEIKDDNTIDLKHLGTAIAKKAAVVFGLDEAKIGYRGNAQDGYKLEIIPAGVWREQEAQDAEAKRVFDELLSQGIPTGQDVQKMKRIVFKTNSNPSN